ncbi:uncharacterized protein LOC126475429 [Schistocerca serialis cubense]|uniref:uncharacterized protein LOC126475429 n=1 Tax=Schistocerca serialis cubense TaxID=2023355 RepID=UPI00214E8F8E|nr:uncharacterized protein LOC126475429 [Schistocerca serialis cubense]
MGTQARARERRGTPADHPLPPEGGWGWAVAAGMALMLISTTGQYGSFGLLFDGVLQQLGAQSTGATLIMNMLSAAVNFTGLVTNRLLRSMTYRMVSVIGGLMFTVGVMLTVFARSMVHIVITYSIIAGVGLGLVVPASYLAFNSYFLERRGLAMGLCQACVGLGFIGAPPVVQALLHSYGFRGAMLVLGGIGLHSVVGAVLYQPVRWHQRRPPAPRPHSANGRLANGGPMHELKTRPATVEEQRLSMHVVPAEEDDLACGRAVSNGRAQVSQGATTPVSTQGADFDERVVVSRRGSMVMSSMLDSRAHLLLMPVDEEGSATAHSPVDIPNGGAEPELRRASGAPRRPPSVSLTNFASGVVAFDNALTGADAASSDQQIVQIMQRRSRRRLSRPTTALYQQQRSLLNDIPDDESEDMRASTQVMIQPAAPRSRKWLRKAAEALELDLLRDPTYVNIALGLAVSFLSDANFFTLMPFFLNTEGLEGGDIATCLSVAAATDVVARLVLPWLAALCKLSARNMYMLGCITSAVARSAFVSVTGFTWLAIMSGVVGFFRGAMVVNLSLTVAEYCSLERFPAAYGLYMVINGLITVILGPLVGILRDGSGSYQLCIHVLSIAMLLCALSWICELVVKWHQKRKPWCLPCWC